MGFDIKELIKQKQNLTNLLNGIVKNMNDLEISTQKIKSSIKSENTSLGNMNSKYNYINRKNQEINDIINNLINNLNSAISNYKKTENKLDNLFNGE